MVISSPSGKKGEVAMPCGAKRKAKNYNKHLKKCDHPLCMSHRQSSLDAAAQREQEEKQRNQEHRQSAQQEQQRYRGLGPR